jgi:UPF0716 protein FxsA
MSTGTPDPYRARRDPHPRRGRRRAWLPLGIAAWALLEIWLLTRVGQAAGGLTVFLLLAAGVVVGAAVIRHAGRRAWQRLAAAARPGAGLPEPGGQAGTGMLTMLGGLLLMVPGLLTDAVGLLCVFPPTAALLSRAGARVLAGSHGPVGTAFQQAREARERLREEQRRRAGDPGGPGGKVVRGEVIRDSRDGEDGGAGAGGGPRQTP